MVVDFAVLCHAKTSFFRFSMNETSLSQSNSERKKVNWSSSIKMGFESSKVGFSVMSVFIFQNLNLVLGWLCEGVLDPVGIVTWVLFDVTGFSPVVFVAEAD